MRSPIILLALLALFLLPGCNEAQIERAAQISAAADARLAQADAALALAQKAVDQGKVLAEQIGSVQATQIVAQAEQGLAAARSASELAKVASDASHTALDAAKAAQAAGGSTVDVILAVVTTAIPSIGGLLLALKKLVENARALRQTVAGVEAAKETMPADQVAKLHAALSQSQDDAVKHRVSLVKATLAGLLLCFLTLAPASATELGLGPSPLAGSATVDSTAITDGAIVNADVNASAAIDGTKVSPDFGSQNVVTTGNVTINTSKFTVAGSTGNTVVAGTLAVSGATTDTVTDAGTGNALNVLTIRHASSGTPSNDFGVQLKFNADSSTNTNRQQLDIFTGWNTATDASRAAGAYFRVFDTAAREFMRVAADGAAARIAFLGTTAAAQQGAEVDADTALSTFGLKATVSGQSTARRRCKVVTGINLNSANTDVGTFANMPAKYKVNAFWLYDASTSLTTATLSVYTGAGATGSAIVNAFAPTANTGATKISNPTVASPATTDYLTATPLYIRNVTAQGSTATATLLIEYIDLN